MQAILTHRTVRFVPMLLMALVVLAAILYFLLKADTASAHGVYCQFGQNLWDGEWFCIRW